MKKYLLLLLFLIPLVFIILPKSNYSKNYITYNTNQKNVEKVEVYVSGEIVNSGIYYFASGATVRDLVRKCGLTDSTYIEGMSISDELINGAAYCFSVTSNSEKERTVAINFSSYIPSASGATLIGTPSDSESGDKININTASAQVLQTLEGIGTVKANRIIEYRNKHKFKSTDELLNVEGISSDTYAKIKNKVTV